MTNQIINKKKHAPLEGVTINGITFLEYLFSDKQGHNYWRCRCPYDSNTFITREDSVKNGNTTSCGCLKKEKARTVGKSNRKKNHIVESSKFDYARVYYDNYDDFFIIDKEDIPLVEEYCWTAKIRKNKQGDIIRVDPIATIGESKILLSRFLMRHELALYTERMQIDHINGDPRDNRRCNLRIATALQNNQNKKSTKQGEIVYENGKYKIINFPKEDTSMLSFDSYAEAKAHLEYLWRKYNIEEFVIENSQKIAKKNKSFVRHNLTWGSYPYNKIQELPAKDPLRIALDEFSSVYASGKVIPDALDRQFNNIAVEYEKEQASER